MSARLSRELQDSARAEDGRISGIRRKTGETTRPQGLDDLQVAAWLERSKEPQLLLDASGRVLALNTPAERLLGVSRAQAFGVALTACVGSVSAQALNEALVSNAEHPLPMADARGRTLGGSVCPLHDRRGVASAYVLSFPDVAETPTDRQGALAAVTRLTAELGHDLNNQLAAVLNYAFVIERRLAGGHPAGEHIGELRASAWRAAGLTRWLQLGGRRPSPGATPLSVHDTLKHLTPLLQKLARDVALEVEVTDATLEISAALSDAELITVALTGIGLDRVASQGTLTLSAALTPNGQGVRVRCAWSDSHAPHRAARSGKPAAHGSLRRALRRATARLGHDASGAWVDFQTVS